MLDDSQPASYQPNRKVITVVAVMCLVVVAFLSKSSREVKVSPTHSQISTKAGENSGYQPSDAQLRCFKKINDISLRNNYKTALETVPRSRDGKYHYFAHDNTHTKKLTDVTEADRGIATALANVRHKALRVDDDAFAFVYPNNVVVEVDTRLCEVNDVYDASPDGNLHPHVATNLLNAQNVDPDVAEAPCPGTYRLRGVASGGYLRMSATPSELFVTFDAVNAQSSAHLGNFEDFTIYVVVHELLDFFIFRIKSARDPPLYCPFMTMTLAGNPTAAGCDTTVLPDLAPAMQWAMVEVQVVNGETTRVGTRSSSISGRDYILYNYAIGKCVCINDKTQTDAAVSGCDCSHANAVIHVEEIP